MQYKNQSVLFPISSRYERYCIAKRHLRRRSGGEVFPIEESNETDNKVITEINTGHQGNSVYNAKGISSTLNANGGGQGGKTGLYAIKNPLKGKTKYGWHFEQNVFDETGISRAVKSSEGSGNKLKVILPVLTPARLKKRQNGRRMKEDGEPMFTLTGQDKHGVMIIDKKGKSKNKNYASTLSGGGHSGGNHSDMDLLAMRWQRTEKGKNARKENQKKGRDYTPFSNGHRELVPVKGKPVGALTAQAIAKDSLIGNHTRIRRLTPTECMRLQGFPDSWCDVGADGKLISDSQKYKMAGNAVTTNVIKAIMEKLL